MPSRHTQDQIMAGPGRNRSSAFTRWIEAKRTRPKPSECSSPVTATAPGPMAVTG